MDLVGRIYHHKNIDLSDMKITLDESKKSLLIRQSSENHVSY